jgi:hypothetical protein
MIHIIYRHTGNVSGVGKNRPHWFSYDRSLNNILSTTEGVDFIKFHLIYDGVYTGADSRIDCVVNFQGGTDWLSYIYAWQYAKSLSLEEKDLVYFVENDYAFVPNWPYKVQELFETYNGLEYVTPYDHPDFYNSSNYPELMTYIVLTGTHHWKTVPSSTGSIIITKKILEEDFDIHTTVPSDRGRFELLTATRSRSVLAPVPSLTTHCEVEWLAPTIDWETVYKNY